MKRLKEGDAVLVTGHAHYEKAVVIRSGNESALLDNQMRITHDYKNLSKTQMKAEPWDQEKFDILHAKAFIFHNLNTMIKGKDMIPDDAVVSINNKLEKWIEKYNLKK